jgi:hypothetical protein
MAIQHQTVTQTFPRLQSLLYPTITVTSTSVATATTPLALTAAQVLGGFIIMDTQDAATATMPTAAALAALIPALQVGTAFEFTIRNSGDSTLTVAGGTGGTMSGTATIATANTKRFLAVCTAIGTTPTFTYYSLGTVTT